MEVDNKLIMTALKFICGKVKKVCRLCLRFTKSAITLDELVGIQTPYYNEKTTSYEDMLADLNVPMELLLPQILCVSCAEITVNSYLFLQLRQFSNEKWNDVLRILNNAFLQSDPIEPSSTTAYLILNKYNNLLLSSRNKNLVKSNRTAVLKDVTECCKTYVKEKILKQNCRYCNKKSSCNNLEHKLHRTSPEPCPHCMKSFPTLNQVKDHIERIHYPKTIPCPECSKKFGTENNLKKHKRLYHTSGICKFCNIEFPTRHKLKAHLDKHGAGTCHKCNKMFASRHRYKLHIKHCGDEKNKYICNLCRKCYTSKPGLASHLQINHGFAKNVLSCKWCNKKFDAISRLKNHIVKHTKERNFYCEHCGDRFVTQPALTYHIRLHTGERPYPCDLCDESFLSASRRMEHKRRKHIGPTKECSLCQKKFFTKFQLLKHRTRHFNHASKLFITDTDHYFPKFPVNSMH